jgi:spermidine synthase
VAVLCGGAVVLILEILGSRLLAPFFGSTIYVWSSLIFVTLLALAVGYRVGGVIADRSEPMPAIFRFLVAAGWLVLAITLIRRGVLPFAAPLGLKAGSLLAAFCLLAPPLVLLGCLAPLAAKAAVGALDELGHGVGGLYALSTVGSLVGALLTGFVLIPSLGVVKILALCALVLFLPSVAWWLGASGVKGRRLWRALAVVGVLASIARLIVPVSFPVTREKGGWTVLHRADGTYSEVKVAQLGANRVLLLDSALQSSQETHTDLSLFVYTAVMKSLILAVTPKPGRVLLIGLGGGTLAADLAQAGATVDAVEVDPAVAEAARRFFMGGREPAVYIEDGRTFLARCAPATYDVLVMDAYAGEAPPPHLFTVEAWDLARRALKPGGIGVANLIGFGGGPHSWSTRIVGRTIGTAFPWVTAYSCDPGDGPTNVIFLYGDRPRTVKSLPSIPMIREVGQQREGVLKRVVDLGPRAGLVLTDDFNPIESMNIKAREFMRAQLRLLFPSWVLLE